jgi:Ca2+-transporting ATPase
MGREGTEVARQAAELVLADDDLRTVVVAIEEGRRILANIRTFLRYALSGGLAEVLVMIVAPFLGMPSPLLPGQILWINMLTHGLPGVAFGAEPADPAVMRRPSASPDKSVLGDRLWLRVAGAGSLIAMVTLFAGTGAGDIESDQQTAMFVVLGLAQLGLAIALRSSNPDRRGLSGHGVELSVLLSALCLAAAVVLEPLRDLLHTAELSGSWFSLVVLATIPGAVVGLLRRRNE